MEAVEFNLNQCPKGLKAFRSSQIRELRDGDKIRMRETSGWRNSLSEAQKKVRSRANLPLLADALQKLGMGGQLGVQQITKESRR